MKKSNPGGNPHAHAQQKSHPHHNNFLDAHQSTYPLQNEHYEHWSHNCVNTGTRQRSLTSKTDTGKDPGCQKLHESTSAVLPSADNKPGTNLCTVQG